MVGVSEVDWDRTVFMLLAPDAVARHLTTTIVDRVERLGFRPVAWRVLWHRPVDLDAFHERNIAHSWQTYLYRLVDQLFAYGPTVALLVRDERDDGTSHARLREAKGASDPADAGPGTIRGDLRSINIMLALVHSADDPEASARESGVFGRDLFHTGDPAELRTTLALLDLGTPEEQRGYGEVLAGVRSRLVAAVWDDLTPPSRARAAELVAGGVPALAAPKAGAQLADLLGAGHPLDAVLRADFTPDNPGPDLARVAPLLRVHGTDLDRWEELVLATSRRFPPRGVAENR